MVFGSGWPRPVKRVCEGDNYGTVEHQTGNSATLCTSRPLTLFVRDFRILIYGVLLRPNTVHISYTDDSIYLAIRPRRFGPRCSAVQVMFTARSRQRMEYL